MILNDNSMAIVILCSHLGIIDEVKPFETIEWNDLAILLHSQGMQPSDLINLSSLEIEKKLNVKGEILERIENLKMRSANLTFELEKIYRTGIKITTRADENYPKVLKKRIGKYCPPLFYYVGNLELAQKPLIGMVGSRTINESDTEFTKQIIGKVIDNHYGVVSGGANGVDLTSSQEAIKLGGYAVEYLANSLQQRLRNIEVVEAIKDGRLLLLSETNPKSGFNTGFAMKRNKYIYGNSKATIVVKADYNKGGTWSGAVENFNKNWTVLFCWNNVNYAGNLELIKKGAIPIDQNWNFSIPKINQIQEIENNKDTERKNTEQHKSNASSSFQQQSLFKD